MNPMVRRQVRRLAHAVLLGLALFRTPSPAGAATLHVWQGSPNPEPPFATWETAARVLQEAADLAQAGDTVIVTNGVYATGGRVVTGAVMNRLAIPAGVTVQSVEGAEVTILEGAPRTDETGESRHGNGDGAIRCVHLGRDSALVGFTLRNGHTRTEGPYDLDQSGGGAWGDLRSQLVKCVLTNNAAHHMGGGAFRVELIHCEVRRNVARYGGGVCLGTVAESLLDGNSAENGAGAYQSRLTGTVLSNNSANIGGGVMGGLLLECTVSGNVAGQWGGGASQATLQKCVVQDNTAERGGGAFLSTLFACVVTGNKADLGGGAAGGTFRHCTITGNMAGAGGGTYLGAAHHCIVHFNEAVLGPNHEGTTFAHSCTTPAPEGSSGVVTSDPRLASTSHVSAESPCRAEEASPPELPTDLDGDPWQAPPFMGADQWIPGQATGVLDVSVTGGYATVAVGHPVRWRAEIQGRTTGSRWDFGDGRVVTHQPIVRHAWEQPGTYEVTLTAFNDSNPDGVRATFTVQVVEQPVHYVSRTPFRPTPPFTSWETAAPTLQAAVDAVTIPGSLVLVTNGVYSTGGASLPGDVLVNRVALLKPVIVRSVHGPEQTFIVGAGPIGDRAVRGAYVGPDAVLSGFTVTNGHTRTAGAPPREQRGGGVYGEALGSVTNCVFTGNLARQFGGGVYRGMLRDCTLVNNSALDGGGGAYESVLEVCVLESNRASNTGGGAARSHLTRCRLAANTAPLGAGASFGTLDFCRLEENITVGDGYGGGANGSTLRDCVLTGNVAYAGGGAYAATLLRCRLEDNEARRDGGGANESTLEECVVVGNTANHGGGVAVSFARRSEFSQNRASVAGGGADGGELEQCTLLNNTSYFGGATHQTRLTHCIVRGNSAAIGGGGYRDLHFNGLLIGNVATNQGGAAFQSQLFHCTVTANVSEVGGGTYEGTNRNCIVYYNHAPLGTDFQGSLLVTSCTGPTPALLPGNVTNAPAFLDPDAGNYRLRAGSPCIDAGGHLGHFVSDDLDGTRRPLDGDGDGFTAFDMGAYEFDPGITDSNSDGVPDSWYRRYGLDPTSPDLAAANPDRDPYTTYEEWVADTDPTDGSSAFGILAVSNQPPVIVYVSGAVGREYSLLRRGESVEGDSSTAPWIPVSGQVHLPGRGEMLALQDTNALASGFYRVEVRLTDAAIRPGLNAGSDRTAFLFGVRRRSGPSDPSRAKAAPDRLLPSGSATNWESADVDISSGWTFLDPTAVGLGGEGGARGEDLLVEALRARPELAAGPPVTSHVFQIPARSDVVISPMLRGQEPFMLYARSARRATLEWGRGATFRGVAGGTDAETYHWKELSSSTRPHAWSYHVDDPPVVTTLEWLREAREFDAEPVFTVNTRGRGKMLLDSQGRRVWTLDPASNSPDYLARLAADWVRYANLIVPRYRLTPDGGLPTELAGVDPEAFRLLQELKDLGNGTNSWAFRLANAAAPDVEVDPRLERLLLPESGEADVTRRVQYWEIGNEVETPMNQADGSGNRLLGSEINLTPAQYVERYLRITEAMKGVDPAIRVGPCPNNPWGPRAGIENQHLIRLLARPDATIDVLYQHYYQTWLGDYFRAPDVNRNLRALKNFAHVLNNQYANQFARAGRAVVPSIISEWNPDWTIHPPVERFMLSALATAEVFMTFVELRHLGAHYWENPAGRASRFIFDRLATHLGDRFLGGSLGERTDDGSYSGLGSHPSSVSDLRLYATQRAADSKVFIWLINLSDTQTHHIEWRHPHPIVEARTHVLRDPLKPTTYYTPESEMQWVSEAPRTEQDSTALLPATIAILELTYQTESPPPPPAIGSLSHDRGIPGSELAIEGEGFGLSPSNNVVHIGNGRATVLEASASTLRVRVPASSTYGPVTVTTGGRTAYSRQFFSLATDPGLSESFTADSLVLQPQRLYPPEGAPIVTSPTDLVLADWPATGRLQLLGLTSRAGSVLPHTIDLYPNVSHPGSPAFETPTCDPQMPLCSLPLNASPARIACGDLDGDGLLDLASVDRHGWRATVWRNSHPTPGRSFEVMGLFPTGRTPTCVALQDIDRDGRPDLVVANSADNTISVLRNLSAGPGLVGFSTNWIFRAQGADALLGPHFLAIGDLVGDARPDVIVVNRSSSTLNLFQNDSVPGRPSLRPLPGLASGRIESLALGDLDGDGELDIVATGQWPGGQLMVWRQQGDDAFERTTYDASRDPRHVVVADLNGDGKPEVVIVNNDTESVSVFRNRSEPGAVDLEPGHNFPIEGLMRNDPIVVAAGDMDGDGRADLAVGHYYSGFITFLHNRMGL